jgi:uncharacterized RDD family membrane protein YckC
VDDEEPSGSADPGADRPGGASRPNPILSSGADAPVVDWATTHPGRSRIGEVAQGIVLAGIGPRVAAFLVDSFILAAASIIIAVLMRKAISDPSTADVIAGIFSALLAVAWFAVAWIGPRAATPGQRLGGMRVVDAATLRPIGPMRAITRSIVLGAAINLLTVPTPISQIAAAILIVWAFVLLGTALFDARRQGLHDRWTRTLVVKPIAAGTTPLTLGCFLMVLIVLLSPVIIAAGGGQALQDRLNQLTPSVGP